ncbi:winged helix-turn-helix transcriptional regulator [Amorphoplanes nipponensis]|uniref:Transcriptional regulator n=1 Tax=Actinoplanes nipponensis TaxID=135950 RepID=A0A919JFL1_9ACTN|nr:winged helix-turn-helix transcriptional regulator [Actinoplanes nipponensis]GIE48286.1 transcriptional regulator [Actinoplanes nipponensis]
MRSYGQYCPVAKASELLGDRWILLIVREMLYGPHRFTALERGLPGISRSVLAARLKRLQRDGIVCRQSDGRYAFTAAGEALRPVVGVLGDWVAHWVMADPTPAELDPQLLMLFISRHVDQAMLPPGRTVIEFSFLGPAARRIWMTLEPSDVSVCPADPQLPIDLTVTSTVADLYRVYIGRTTLAAALRADRVRLCGTSEMVRGFHRWMLWSGFAPATRAGLAAVSA